MRLSKSKYLLGIQCARYMWTSVHEKEKLPEVDASTQHRFDQGHIVGELAKGLYPKGTDIPTEDYLENIKETEKLVKEKKILFEAGFQTLNLYMRADIIIPVKDKWDLIEVKSGTKPKEVNYHDLSFQKHVLEEKGLKINKCYVINIDNSYIRKGEIKVKKLFKKTDVTKEVKEKQVGIKQRIKILLETLNKKKLPIAKPGAQCTDPYTCPLNDCWDFLPEHSILTLYNSSGLELLEKGIHSVVDIPKDVKLQPKQKIQKESILKGKEYIDKEKIKEFLKTIKKPISYLDFETFSIAIPLYDFVKPYHQIPFQFSLHIENKKIKHISYLAKGDKDPRKEFLETLKEKLPAKGSIVVYNASFEKRILRELGAVYPKHKEWIESLNERIVDLLIPFRNFWYYNPKQMGSASIKKVLPALTEKSYEDLGISGGVDASVTFLSIVTGKLNPGEVDKSREELEAYCKLDTEGMVWILKELRPFTS